MKPEVGSPEWHGSTTPKVSVSAEVCSEKDALNSIGADSRGSRSPTNELRARHSQGQVSYSSLDVTHRNPWTSMKSRGRHDASADFSRFAASMTAA
jgi:hypothetical protein